MTPEKIKEVRVKLGLSQAKFGAPARVGAKYISEIESGRRRVPFHIAARIRNAYAEFF